MDPLTPHRALVDQRHIQPDPLAPLQHALGWDPTLGQLPSRQQISQQAGVGAVGLGSTLPAPQPEGVVQRPVDRLGVVAPPVKA
jgi:hypothetical protein